MMKKFLQKIKLLMKIIQLLFEYAKRKNIFKAKKNAVANDFEKETTIYADEIIYLKNDEKVFTKGKTKALIENRYKFDSENISYYRNSEDLFSQKASSSRR